MILDWTNQVTSLMYCSRWMKQCKSYAQKTLICGIAQLFQNFTIPILYIFMHANSTVNMKYAFTILVRLKEMTIVRHGCCLAQSSKRISPQQSGGR